MNAIAVAGAAGRMGRELIRAVVDDPQASLAGGFERPDHEALGQDLGGLAGRGRLKIELSSDFETACGKADVLIDFTSPAATLANAEKASANGLAMVAGATGLSQEQTDRLAQSARRVPIVYAPNMSVGINLLLSLVEEAARRLGPAYDLEIFEAHHKMKVDAPSGTALALARAIAAGRGLDLDQVGVTERSGQIGPRKKDEIGIQTIRGGDIVGEHTVLMIGTGERLEFVHRCHSRATFAQGAVRAALWAQGREPGLYNMRDVLGLK